MDAVSSAGVPLVAQHGVRLLLFAAERQEWCFLVCSSGLPSYPVAWSSRWCRLSFGGLSVMEALGRISSSTLPVSPRRSQLEIWTLPSPLYLSVLRCLGVACGVRRIRDACAFWFHSGYIFYVAVNSNPEAFSLHSDRMEKCAQLILLVAVSLSAVRTLNLSTISPWWRCGFFFDTFCVSFRAPPVVPELSASFSSFRALTTVSARVRLPGDLAPGLPITAPMLLI